MVKKISLAFVTLSLVAGVYAQTYINNKVLAKMAKDYANEATSNYAKAVSLAKEKGWPLTMRTKNGGTAQLVGVDFFGFPQYFTTWNTTVPATTTRASQLWPGGSTGLNLTGSSNKVTGKLGIWDGGKVLNTHVEINGRVVQKDNPTSTSDHSTHVAGIMIALGINPVARGMAYGAQQLIAYDFNNHISEIATESDSLLLSNHSYGTISGWYYNSSPADSSAARWEFWGRSTDNEDYKFGYYSSEAQAFDSITYNAPWYLPVLAAGNPRDQNGPAVGQPYYRYNANNVMDSAGNRPAGISNNDSYNTIATYGNSKNVLTVGAIQGLPSGYNKPSDVVMTGFSGWGPTDDGRIKPDVVADGVNVTSSIATSNTSYATYSGTSMATPNATGSLYLLQEYYAQLHPNTFMRSSTLKALTIQTADEAGTSPGPDYQFGWGLVNVQKAANVITSSYHNKNDTIIEKVLNNGGTYSITVTASGTGGPIVATLGWTDPAGAVDLVNVLNNTAPKLINDLDLRITKGGSTYKPWVLDPKNPGFGATTGDNILDNVERINVDSTVPGQTYTITVSHKGTLQRGAQAYSLIISGIGGTAYCTSAASSSSGTRIDSVAFAGITNKNTVTNTTYTDFTSLTAQIEPNQTVPVTIRLNSSDATNTAKVVKVFIDYNNNGVFTDAGELAATINAPGNGTYTANITTPGSLTVGNITLLRIVAQETTDTSIVLPCGNYPNGETQDYRVKIVAPSNNLAVTDITMPVSGACASPVQYITAQIQNKGTVAKSNIPLTAVIKSGTTTVATITESYPLTIPGGALASYTFQTPFATVAGTTYNISVTATATGDQDPTDNTKSMDVAIAAKPAAPAGTGEICGSNTAYLKVTNPNSGTNYFWYSSPTAATPIAIGSSVTTSVITADKNYYLQTGARVSVGPINKAVYGTGGYNAFYNNYVKIHAYVPVTIETAKLYIGNSGNVEFILGNNLTQNSDGTFSFSVLQDINLNAYASNPTPGTPPTADNPADSGSVYNLNLQIPGAGDYIILVRCTNGASIFRNNNITGGATYPTGIPNIFTITGNSVLPSQGDYQAYYYFFYDMRISTAGCVSDKVTVAASTAPVPAITQVGDSLSSSINSGNQWYFNGASISGATGKSIKPGQAGIYSVIVTDAFGCQRGSADFNYVATAIQNVSGAEIGLVTTPNPANTSFTVRFTMNTRADIAVGLINTVGQTIFSNQYHNFSGNFNRQYSSAGIAPGTYILKVWQNNKVYHTKILIIH